MSGNVLKVDRITKIFGTDPGTSSAVDNVSFELDGSEFFTMLGPSGCGKTTTLRMIAGLERATSGAITFNGTNFDHVPAFQRNIGMVFQSYALFPHMTVRENISYGLRVRRAASDDIRRRVDDMTSLLGLADLSHRHPADLSGGQQQRVSLARALVYSPSILLLDEPLANLDAKLRVEMREEIRRIQRELGIMTIYVTHDQEEAMSVSDRLAVFNAGRLVQCGTPHEVYTRPTSLFVADFLGKANLFLARLIQRSPEDAQLMVGRKSKVWVGRTATLPADEEALLDPHSDAIIMVRPQHLELEAGPGGLPCTVVRIEYLGNIVRYVVSCPFAPRRVIVDAPAPYTDLGEGDGSTLEIHRRHAQAFCKAPARPGCAA